MSIRILILGAGFAGFNVARRLERIARHNEIAVTIVSRENYMLFTPMLPEVSSGSIEPRHIAPPLRAILRHTVFELGDVTSVDLGARTVALRKRRQSEVATLPYDQLVIALGSENSTHDVPGASDHTFPLKTLPDAIALRDVVITALENAATARDERERRSLMTFVVVGGGFTGVEAAGELLAFVRRASRLYPRMESAEIRMVLVAGSDRLLEQLQPKIGSLACAMLVGRGVDVVLGDRVASIDAGGITLNSGKRYESRCIVWSAGDRPAQLAAELPLAHSPHHAVLVNPDLSVRGAPNVWALGDCAYVPKPAGGAYPQTAQHAIHEAKALARNLLASARERKTKPYVYRSRGMMASLGAHEGVAALPGGCTIGGFGAWLLWRSFYLSQLPGADRKARVMLDWTLELPFPQDIASVR